MATWAPASQHSPLGDDQLIPIGLVANEQISQPFTFDVCAVCQQAVVDLNACLSQSCCITLQNAGSPVAQSAVPPAPNLTGTAVAGWVTLAAVRSDIARRDARLHQFLESGCNITTGGLRRLPAETG
jgi:uncharacterized protein involved in type VI secretion and phage assembly